MLAQAIMGTRHMNWVWRKVPIQKGAIKVALKGHHAFAPWRRGGP